MLCPCVKFKEAFPPSDLRLRGSPSTWRVSGAKECWEDISKMRRLLALNLFGARPRNRGSVWRELGNLGDFCRGRAPSNPVPVTPVKAGQLRDVMQAMRVWGSGSFGSGIRWQMSAFRVPGWHILGMWEGRGEIWTSNPLDLRKTENPKTAQ